MTNTFFNNSLFEKLLGVFLFIIGGGLLFYDVESLDLPRIFTISLFFIAGGLLERKFLVKQNEIIARISEIDVSRQFNKIIEVNEGIIDTLESMSKDAKDGDILFLKGRSSVYDVTLMGNNTLELNGNFTFTSPEDRIQLVRDFGKWKEQSRTDYP